MCYQDNTSLTEAQRRLPADREVHLQLADDLEHAMVSAHGIPVTVMWSFRLFELMCERRDGQPLSAAQQHTWTLLLGQVAELEAKEARVLDVVPSSKGDSKSV